MFAISFVSPLSQAGGLATTCHGVAAGFLSLATLAGRGCASAHGVVDAFGERAGCSNDGNTIHGHLFGSHQINVHTIEHLDSGNKKAPSGGPEGALVFLQPWLALKR
jgi:hypothetical protein